MLPPFFVKVRKNIKNRNIMFYCVGLELYLVLFL